MADLRYGATLYEYFQGNYFEALSELMVAEARGGIKGHGDNPALIKGGISLSFGMEQNAGDLFAELLSADESGEFSRPLEVRNAAWFYLAKLRYLRGDWDGTEESLSRITGRFDKDLLAELESTVINLAIRRDDLAAAEAQLGKLRHAEDRLHYIYYNLGNAYGRAQNFEQANYYYRRLAALTISDLPSRQEEQLALYDKAMTAAGYSNIMQGQPREAIQQFSRVRLDSPFSKRALLGYGWAAAETDDYRLALKPWQALSELPLIHAPVQEALIAVPYAYEQLGAQGQALQAYIDAEDAFQAEMDRIDQVMSQIDQLDVLSALNITDTDNRDWFLLDETSGARPHLVYLAELFSLNHFQGSIQELRDLLHMAQRLRSWQVKLNAYRFMLQEREINRVSQLQAIARQNMQGKLRQMIAARDQLDRELERIAAQRDYFALVSEEEKELVDIARSAEQSLALLKQAGEPVEEYEALVKRYRGLLFWEASQQFPERQWEVRRRIRQLNDAILEAETNLDRLRRVINEAPDIAPYRRRIAIMSERLDEQTARVDAALALAETTLRGKVSEELTKQRGRLQHYMAEARLSVARLYDLAAQEQRQ
ncbi:MAG: hypothetical protein WDZ30_00740 [Cellvibrionaceae bacterium]